MSDKNINLGNDSMHELIKRLRESVDSSADKSDENADFAPTNSREQDEDLRELLLSQLNAKEKECDAARAETVRNVLPELVRVIWEKV